MTEPLTRRRRVVGWRRWALGLLAGLALVAALGAWGVGRVGHWLIVADPLSPAQAIVILKGHIPMRAMEAAQLYHDGWAPEVWILRATPEPEEEALRRLDLPFWRREALERAVLERLEVPPDAIRLLTAEPGNTVEELRLVAEELRRVRGDRVIVVTSKAHTRRVRVTWNAVAGKDLRAVVRFARQDPYDPARWWRKTREALAVSREVFGLLNAWAGFPLKPERPSRP